MKKHHFKECTKNTIWTFLDYIWRFITISVLWFVFSSPFLYTIVVFLYSKIFFIPCYIVLLIIISFSPISLGAAYYIKQIVSQSASSKQLILFPKYESDKLIKLSVFFKGIYKYFFKSIILILVISFISLFIYFNLYFYLKILTPKSSLIGLVLTGIMAWIGLVFYLTQIYIIPLSITKDISSFKIIYQSFLLVADNMVYSFFVGLLLVSLSVIMGFTIAGIFLIFYGIVSLLQMYSYLYIYKKYDPSLDITNEHRTIKDIIKPW